MDKNKKIIRINVILIILLFAWAFTALSQQVDSICFGKRQFKYGKRYDRVTNDSIDNDSITFFLKVLGPNGRSDDNLEEANMREHFGLKENDELVPKEKWTVETLTSGQRIPNNYTISVLVDLGIPQDGKEGIFETVKTLVESAGDSCVYLSFFGDEVSNSQLVNKNNYPSFHDQFMKTARSKYFYSALYAKLNEFNFEDAEYDNLIKKQDGYRKENEIFYRAELAPDRNLLFVFTEGSRIPKYEGKLDFIRVTQYQMTANDSDHHLPRVYAFFYDAGNGIDPKMENTLIGVTHPKDENMNPIRDRQGDFKNSNDIDSILQGFKQVVRNEMFDFKLSYQVPEDKSYRGTVQYTALWDGEVKGAEKYDIGLPEHPWPDRTPTAGDSAKNYLIALLVAFLAILLFIAIMKIFIPGFKSIVFSIRHYKRYKPKDNVKVLICPLCRCEILPNDRVVTKCQHIMHVPCWKENDYKCVEYGQNCKEGIQDHIHWKYLFSSETLRDCFMTIMGVCASLVGWIIYDVTGKGFFNKLASALVNAIINTEGQSTSVELCVSKVSSFLTIGLLLGFFLSFVFRFFDGVKRKNFLWFLEITGLSLLSSLIGMAAFALGGIILCLWVSPTATVIPWYCSFPAYLLFSVCTTLSLAIRSTIPFKSALLGGLVSAIIGFIVLYFSHKAGEHWDWMPILLNFVIFGGGLGASLITVRMLAEKYFLVVKNGIRSGLRIPIHKWMNAGSKVTIGMTQQCEIQMGWEKSNKVAKEHVQLYVNQNRSQAMMKPLAATTFNMRTELDSNNNPVPLFNGDTFKVGDTIFEYVEN